MSAVEIVGLVILFAASVWAWVGAYMHLPESQIKYVLGLTLVGIVLTLIGWGLTATS